MVRDRNRKHPEDSPYQPAWRMWRKYGITGWKLQRLARQGRIRHQESTTVFIQYLEEDVKALAEKMGARPPAAAEKRPQAAAAAK